MIIKNFLISGHPNIINNRDLSDVIYPEIEKIQVS